MPGIVVRVKVDAGKLDALISSTPRADEMIAKRSAIEVAQGARARAPVLTGELRDSISFDGVGSVWFVEAAAGHALYQEFGTRFQSGTPFLIPAKEAVDYMRIARSVLRELGW